MVPFMTISVDYLKYFPESVGRGVCGSAWKAGETIVVPDVEKFPGHIACSSESRSEIVVPLWKGQ